MMLSSPLEQYHYAEQKQSKKAKTQPKNIIKEGMVKILGN